MGKIPNLDEKLREAKEIYDKNVQEVGKKQAFAATFSILGHIAVGLYGIQHGVDTSGIKFDPYDWSADYKNIMDQYKLSSELRMQEYSATTSRRQQFIDAIQKGAYESAALKEKQGYADAEQKRWAATQALGEKRESREEEAMGNSAIQHTLDSLNKEVAIVNKNLDKAEITKLSTHDRISLVSGEAERLRAAGAPLISFPEWQEQNSDKFTFPATDIANYRDYVVKEAARFYQTKEQQIRNGQPTSSSKPQGGDKHPDQLQNGHIYTWNGSKYVPK